MRAMPYHNTGPATQPAEPIETPSTESPDHDESQPHTDTLPEATVDSSEDLSQGYRIILTAKADGTFSVANQDHTTLREAVQGMLAVLEAHPIQASDQGQFEAGYGREEGARELDAPEPGLGGML